MSVLIIILISLGGLIALLLLAAFFMRKNYRVHSDILINAPVENVFEYVRMLKNQDNFNKWVMVDTGMQRNFKGTDGTVGFIYGWNGNKQAGEGELEIKSLQENHDIVTEIRFVRPFPGIAKVVMTTEPVSADQTKVTWSNESKMNYPMNLMLGMIEKMLVKDMNYSLQLLKSNLEK